MAFPAQQGARSAPAPRLTRVALVCSGSLCFLGKALPEPGATDAEQRLRALPSISFGSRCAFRPRLPGSAGGSAVPVPCPGRRWHRLRRSPGMLRTVTERDRAAAERARKQRRLTGARSSPGRQRALDSPEPGNRRGSSIPSPGTPGISVQLRGHGRSRRAPPRAPQPPVPPAAPGATRLGRLRAARRQRCRSSSPHPPAGAARRSPHPGGQQPLAIRRHSPALGAPLPPASGSARGDAGGPRHHGNMEIRGRAAAAARSPSASRGSARLSPAGLSSPPRALPECGERGSAALRPPRHPPAASPGALPAPRRPRARFPSSPACVTLTAVTMATAVASLHPPCLVHVSQTLQGLFWVEKDPVVPQPRLGILILVLILILILVLVLVLILILVLILVLILILGSNGSRDGHPPEVEKHPRPLRGITDTLCLCSTGTQTVPSPSSGVTDSSQQTDWGIAVLNKEMVQLSNYLKEALHRELLLKQKMVILQELLSTLLQASEKSWQGQLNEDKLRCKLRVLENQLQACSQNYSKECVKKILIEMEDHKQTYEQKAKEALQKMLEEKLQAEQQLQNSQRSLAEMRENLSLWKEHNATLKAELSKETTAHTELRNSFQALQSELQRAAAQSERLSRELRALRDERAELLQTASALRSDNDRQAGHIRHLQDKLQKEQEHKVTLEATISHLQNLIHNQNNQQKSQEVTVQRTDQVFTTQTPPLTPAKEKQNALSEHPEEEEEEEEEGAESLKDEMQKRTSQLTAKENECSELRSELEALSQEYQSCLTRLRQCRDELNRSHGCQAQRQRGPWIPLLVAVAAVAIAAFLATYRL
ncbi:TRAF3-interacting JNK-activating modulator [Motacilla alba alba]|uniref:TRAF3-interacting JNK-activating modulator n=1 Tax=Motacilla alba alba TaxID=1094192 RepID=UPI0018D51AC6|nr:TRAF3-interacting JNK-activating modulator [Motacilla alba alba]